jgi:type I restriction enzyme S subunit
MFHNVVILLLLARSIIILTCASVSAYFLKRGDVLFNNTNSRELGKTTIVEEDIDVCFSNHITRIRVDQAIVEPKWFALCLHRHWVFGTFEANCKRWIGQAGFNPTK